VGIEFTLTAISLVKLHVFNPKIAARDIRVFLIRLLELSKLLVKYQVHSVASTTTAVVIMSRKC
jgi:hypothetical protein